MKTVEWFLKTLSLSKVEILVPLIVNLFFFQLKLALKRVESMIIFHFLLRFLNTVS